MPMMETAKLYFLYTVCTSNQCECDTGFSGQDFQSFRCCHWDGM